METVIEYVDQYGYVRAIEVKNRAHRLGLSIKFGRIALGMTQAELGEKVGVSQQEISHIECGRRVPNALLMEDIRALLRL